MVDLVVQVLTNIHTAIKTIQDKITAESSKTLDDCHEHYLAGLSDALEIVKDCANNDLVVGNTYYVVMPQDEATNTIVKMRLYKITQKHKLYYSFTADSRLKYPSNDLTLSNPQSIKMRIFETEEEAEKNKDIMIWRRELRRSNW